MSPAVHGAGPLWRPVVRRLVPRLRTPPLAAERLWVARVVSSCCGGVVRPWEPCRGLERWGDVHPGCWRRMGGWRLSRLPFPSRCLPRRLRTLRLLPPAGAQQAPMEERRAPKNKESANIMERILRFPKESIPGDPSNPLRRKRIQRIPGFRASLTASVFGRDLTPSQCRCTRLPTGDHKEQAPSRPSGHSTWHWAALLATTERRRRKGRPAADLPARPQRGRSLSGSGSSCAGGSARQRSRSTSPTNSSRRNRERRSRQMWVRSTRKKVSQLSNHRRRWRCG